MTEHSTRPHVAAIEQILGTPFSVLDDGFIRVVDYMGDDAAVVQAARVSYGAGTKKTLEDRGLIRYLMRHWHTTPFEMCEIKFHIRAPMDLWRQWIRHRTANVNEYSTRYSIAIDAAQRTASTSWRTQSQANRQGSAETLPEEIGANLSEQEKDLQQLARRVYEERIAANVAREQARKDLPLSTYTEAYWKIDLHNLLHFLRLRMDVHAQAEIRAYATVIGEQIVARWVPMVWEAFRDYRRQAVEISRSEALVLSAIVNGNGDLVSELLQREGFTTKNDQGAIRLNREGREFESKLQAMGITLPPLGT